MAKKIKKKKNQEKIIVKNELDKSQDKHVSPFSPKMIGLIADEVAKTLMKTLPKRRVNGKRKKPKKIENPIFLDTSAIIDGRVFDIVNLKVFNGTFVILESVLLELKHIADSPDEIKKEKGRRGLSFLEKLKKTRGIKVEVLSSDKEKSFELDKVKEVDEKLIKIAKAEKGKIITCDFNLEKKANISGVTAININTLANLLKVRAIPGEAFFIKLLHVGKDITQGVGYFDDGTMVVVENGSVHVGETVNVRVIRVIQTTAGRILFTRKNN
jgi:uncharacterized protein YacL